MIKWGRNVAVLAGLLLLGACASDGGLEEARRLAAAGRWEESIQLLENGGDEPAARRGPVLVDTRSRAIQELLRRGDGEREQGNASAAAGYYERVLRLERGNLRAQAGLQAIEDQRRRDKALDEVDKLLGRGSLDEAERRLRPVLVEAPQLRRAQALKDKITERRQPRGSIIVPGLRLPASAPISLEFRDANLKMVFDAFSRASGVNFVLDRDIRADAKATVLLKNSSLEDAIASLLMTNQLEKRVLNDNTLFIFQNTPQKLKEYQDLAIRNFFLAHADGKQMMNLLKTILKVKDVFVDEKRNLLVVRDTPEVIALAEKLVAAHDQAEPEVMLMLDVLEVKRTRLSELGLEFPKQIAFGVGGGTTPTTIQAARGLPASIVNVSGLNPLLGINLSKTLSDANLLANPRIRVRNREKAKIHVGDRVPYSTTTTSATTSLITQNVTYLDVGLKLEVEPQVYLDDDVAIKVTLEVSSVVKDVPLGNGQTVPQVGTRNASTTLSLKSGETQILAGLIRDDEKLTTSRLPGLGDIPLLGRLFSSENSDAEKTEIILSITPHVLRNLERPEAALTEYLSGPETGARGAVGGAAPAVPPAAPALAPGRGAPPPGMVQPAGIVPQVMPAMPAAAGTMSPVMGSPQPAAASTLSAPAAVPLPATPESAVPTATPTTPSSGAGAAPIYFDPPPGVAPR